MESGEIQAVTQPEATADRSFLAMADNMEPGDQHLGQNLRSLDLIDDATLSALLIEARRQRRSLRQLLLAGGYLTLHQMALIETGDLDKLVLGPVRVIDRIQANTAETIYRVFDPRSNREAILRILSEAELEDAMRPDEYCQRFAACSQLHHPQVQETYEVFDIGGRPAVLQELLKGVPANELPPLAAAPGVWLRLFIKAANAIQTIHSVGLVHGNLDSASFVFTPEGELKLQGFGEPAWLRPTLADEPTFDQVVLADLAALGRTGKEWADLGPRKGNHPKALPDPLPTILTQLVSEDPATRIASADQLLESLDGASKTIPPNLTAWEKFLREIRDRVSNHSSRASA